MGRIPVQRSRESSWPRALEAGFALLMGLLVGVLAFTNHRQEQQLQRLRQTVDAMPRVVVSPPACSCGSDCSCCRACRP